jgi:hypothetical protein
MGNSIKQLEEVLSKANPKEQRVFLARLPKILKISWSDLSLLKASQESFDFWNNKEDAIYDNL